MGKGEQTCFMLEQPNFKQKYRKILEVAIERCSKDFCSGAVVQNFENNMRRIL